MTGRLAIRSKVIPSDRFFTDEPKGDAKLYRVLSSKGLDQLNTHDSSPEIAMATPDGIINKDAVTTNTSLSDWLDQINQLLGKLADTPMDNPGPPELPYRRVIQYSLDLCTIIEGYAKPYPKDLSRDIKSLLKIFREAVKPIRDGKEDQLFGLLAVGQAGPYQDYFSEFYERHKPTLEYLAKWANEYDQNEVRPPAPVPAGKHTVSELAGLIRGKAAPPKPRKKITEDQRATNRLLYQKWLLLKKEGVSRVAEGAKRLRVKEDVLREAISRSSKKRG